ncbi:MAG: glycosyltransferase family 39 protein, partial [Actinomycetota bacterium]|nr:glycosyltransferase family 39 protein [Actinomycetota bacterium]
FPYGELHESAARPPGYMLFIGAAYTILGASPTRVTLLQTLIGPVVIVLVWLLARRLFDARVAVVAAALAAVHPNLWQWEGRLYSEALALPLAVLLLLLVLQRQPTKRVLIGTGVVLGVSLLVRPTSVFLVPVILAAFWTAANARTAIRSTAAVLGVAVLCVAPWTIRNYALTDSFIPLSLQDMAVAGTFNPMSAEDPDYPYAWRPWTERDQDIFGGVDTPNKLSEADLHEEMLRRAREYVEDHPEAIPEAFFWNGIVRTWDLRSSDLVLLEVGFEGRNEHVARAGMLLYWALLPFAAVGVWRLRARRTIVVPVLLGAVAASVVFTVAAATRYRVPYEPVVVLLASVALVHLWDRVRGERAAEPDPELADVG